MPSAQAAVLPGELPTKPKPNPKPPKLVAVGAAGKLETWWPPIISSAMIVHHLTTSLHLWHVQCIKVKFASSTFNTLLLGFS